MQKLAVIIGRFQTPIFHHGYEKLFSEARKVSENILILVGTSPITDKKNPYNYCAVSDFLSSKAPHIGTPKKIYKHKALYDHPNDDIWFESLLQSLEGYPMYEPVFIVGETSGALRVLKEKKCKVVIVPNDYSVCSTDIRENAEYINSDEFRKGMLYQEMRKFDTVYSTVDVIPVLADKSILLGKKRTDDKYRFIGGFVAPGDVTLEVTLRRELKEETGLYVTSEKIVSIGSCRVDDWRYKDSNNKIMTNVFMCFMPTSDRGIARDDIVEVKSFNYTDVPFNLIDSHSQLWNFFSTKIKETYHKGIINV